MVESGVPFSVATGRSARLLPHFRRGTDARVATRRRAIAREMPAGRLPAVVISEACRCRYAEEIEAQTLRFHYLRSFCHDQRVKSQKDI